MVTSTSGATTWPVDYYAMDMVSGAVIDTCMQLTCSCISLLKRNPTRCINFPNLLRHEILHVSSSSSASHQEFIHCTLGTDICHTGLKTAFEQGQDGPARKLSSNDARSHERKICSCIFLKLCTHKMYWGKYFNGFTNRTRIVY